MRSNTARVAVALGAIALVVVLFVVLNGDDSNDSSSTTATTQQGGGTGATGKADANGDGQPSQTNPQLKPPVTIVVKNGKPEGGVKKLEYKKSDQVRLVVRSDVADEIHVHGYNLKKDVPAGGSVRSTSRPTSRACSRSSSRAASEQIAELRVSPS